MLHILQAIERHSVLVDLAIKASGVALTLAGAGWVAWKHFADRKAARLQTELDLRREAYFELFSAIPLQMAALGRFSWADNEPMVFNLEGSKAQHRLHLLASHDALQCIIARNTIYHEGIVELSALKRKALQFQAIVDGGNEQGTESMLRAWESFRARFRELIGALGSNYRDLLVFARKEIGLGGGVGEILKALEGEQKAAMAVLERVGF
jgi:hypothetical protein